MVTTQYDAVIDDDTVGVTLIKCAENDPGSCAYIRDATPEQREAFDRGLTEELFDHVMIDIETMSLHPNNALILSIGLIEFTPEPIEGLRIGKRKLIIPSIEQQLILGREVSASTQKWWMAQSKEARAHWAEYVGERRSMAGTLKDVRDFCRNASRVWANGTQFDLSNLVGLNMQMGAYGQSNDRDEPELWHYQAPRDMRSFCRETPPTRIIPPSMKIDGVPHDPVYDCIVQAHKVWGHWAL
jgi:hypothetical protein